MPKNFYNFHIVWRKVGKPIYPKLFFFIKLSTVLILKNAFLLRYLLLERVASLRFLSKKALKGKAVRIRYCSRNCKNGRKTGFYLFYENFGSNSATVLSGREGEPNAKSQETCPHFRIKIFG